MALNIEHKGATWECLTEISGKVLENYDFSETDFNNARFIDVKFINCLFNKSNISDSRIYRDSSFECCRFVNVDFSSTTIGSHKGDYIGCLFEKCKFQGVLFSSTRFRRCHFMKTKFKTVNFNGSTFHDCIFSGKFDDVSFNGLYDTNSDRKACLNNVDFSEASFGEYVSFYNCDLSTCIPPKNHSFDELLYHCDLSEPTLLSTGSKDRVVIGDFS